MKTLSWYMVFCIGYSSALFSQAGGTWEAVGSQPAPNLGATVRLDDLNFDGFSEYGVGDLDNQIVNVYSGLDESFLFALSPPQDSDNFGQTIASLGDLNGYAVGEIAIGAPLTDAAYTDQGAVYVYSGVNGSEITTLWGNVSHDQFGFSVSNAFDINQDGWDDLFIGAPNADVPGRGRTGGAYVYSGLDFSLLMFMGGTRSGDQFGKSVQGTTDLNLDGWPDLAVAAPLFDHSGSSNGSLTIFSGQNGGLLHFLKGQSNDQLGGDIEVLQDLDNDGSAEIAVSAPTGKEITVISGMTGAILTRITKPGVSTSFGNSMSSGMDVDFDGNPDLLVADPGRNSVYAFSASEGHQIGPDVYSNLSSFGYSITHIKIGTSSSDQQLLCRAQGLLSKFTFQPVLSSSHPSVSSALGGSVDFFIDFPISEAGLFFLLLGSASGRGPTYVQGVDVPLTDDPLFRDMLAMRPPGNFINQSGLLDLTGNGTAQLSLASHEAANHIGRIFYFAVLSYAPPNLARISSVAVKLEVLP